MHFDYDLDIKLNPEKFDTKIYIEGNYYSIFLSDEFNKFLLKIFSVFSSNKYYLNRYDIHRIFETVYGKLIRSTCGKLFRRFSFSERRIVAIIYEGLAFILDVI